MTFAPIPSLADPSGSSALAAAAGWVQQTMLGTVATSIAVIAVASIGLLMLSGRIDVRRGMTVVIGCFVLFGAPGIVAGIMGMAGGGVEAPVTAYAPPPPVVAPPAPAATAQYDPYAGASVR